MELEAAKLIAGALAMLPALGVGIGLGLMFSAWNEAVGRNPNAAPLLEKKFLLMFALTEALGIIPICIGLLLIFG